MQHAAKIADDTISEVSKFIRPGLTEGQIADKLTEIHNDLARGVCKHVSHIVASGANAALPHYNGDSRVIQEKDIVLIDFSGRYKSYFSDMTRTFLSASLLQKKEIYITSYWMHKQPENGQYILVLALEI